MGCKLRMMTCRENELTVAEFGLRGRGMGLVKHEESKKFLPGKESKKRLLSGFETGLGMEKYWALIWYDEEEQ